VLQLAGGPKAALTATKDLCAGHEVVEAEFGAQSGAATRGRATATVAGCPALRATGELSGVARGRPTLRLTLTSLTPLRRVRVALPASMAVASRAVLRRDGRLVIEGRRVNGATFAGSQGAVVVTLARAQRSLQVTLPRGVLRLRSARGVRRHRDRHGRRRARGDGEADGALKPQPESHRSIVDASPENR
jgi:hypothetical protein